jgi:O-antigen/teichoic acid export membrane protein
VPGNRGTGFEAGAILGLVGRISGYGSLFLFQLALVRTLGPGPAGRVFPVLALVALLAVVGRFGLDRVGLREISRHLEEQRAPDARGVAGWILGRVAGISLVVSAVALVGVRAVGGSLALEDDPGALLLLVLSVPPFAVAFAAGELVRGGRRVGQSAMLQLILPYGLATLGLLWMWTSTTLLSSGSPPGVLAVARLWLLSTTAAAALGLALVHRMTAGEGRIPPGTGDVAGMVASAPAILWTSLVVMALSQLDVLILGFLMEGETISRYVAASRLAMVASLALVGVNAILAPLFVRESRLAGEGQPERLQDVAQRGARWGGGLAAAAASIVALGGPLFLALFDPGFTDAHPVLLILLAGQVVNAATGGVLLMLQMTGYERVGARTLSVVAVLLIPSYVLAIEVAGITGAAMVTALGLAGGNLAMVAACRRVVGVLTLSDRWPQTLGLFLSAGIVAWVAWTRAPELAPWIGLGGALTVPGVVWWWLFEGEDRDWFREAFQVSRKGTRAREGARPS